MVLCSNTRFPMELGRYMLLGRVLLPSLSVKVLAIRAAWDGIVIPE